MMWCECMLLSVMVGASQWHFLQGLPHTPPPNYASFNSSKIVSPHPTQLTIIPNPSLFDPTLPSTRTSHSTKPCTAKSVEAWRDERVSSQLAFQYRIGVEDSQQCKGLPKCDDGKMMMARPCKTSYQHEKKLYPQRNGSFEVCWGDCTELSCGSIKNRPNVPQLLDLKGNVTLKNSTLMLVPLEKKPFPDFVKHLKVVVVLPKGGNVSDGIIVKEATSLLEIPGTYDEYSYIIQYKIISTCTGDWWTRLVDETGTLQLPKPPDRSMMVMALSVTAVVLVLAVGVLATVLFIKHHPSLQFRPTQPWLGLHCSDGDILLIHGRDTPEVVKNSHSLAQKVTSYCNRKVHDLCSLNDRGFAEDPSAWLLNVLTQQQEVTIVLVLTPALMKAVQHIMRDPDVKGLGPEPDSRDLLIYDCLRTLQNNPKNYFHRLVLVRLNEGVATDSKELLYFTPRCPILLSKEEDQQNLLAALHPDPSHKPPHTASTTSYSLSCI